jgi:hypothetical protein
MSVTRQIVWNKPEDCLPEVRSDGYDYEKSSSPVLYQDRLGGVMVATYVVDDFDGSEQSPFWQSGCSESWKIKPPVYWAYIIKP